MKINLQNHIALDRLSHKNGFGYAAEHIEKSLLACGYELGKENADVQLWWDQPNHFKWDQGVYRIAYFPWESTELLPGWIDKIDQADEVWTPSPLIAEWLVEKVQVHRPVFVYEHGIDDIWIPQKRVVEDKVKFLHMGFESQRKFGPQTLNAFRTAFAGNDDVELTLKMWMPSMKVPYTGKIRVVNEKQSIEQLVQLFADHHVFSFVSGGEGFGFPPLQALAQGMPTIINELWAPYRRFCDTRLSVDSKVVTSPWVKLHPGEVLRPDFDQLIDRMRFAFDNYETLAEHAYKTATKVHEAYSWDKVTADAFSALESRLK